MNVVKEGQLTLKQIEMGLCVDQHILIHLCEKWVVKPDFEDTYGRGRWRKFSRRNYFEFSLALNLRKYEIPVGITAVIIRLLRTFERSIKKHWQDFLLIDTLVEDKAGISLYLYDGEYLAVHVGVDGREEAPLIMGFNIKKLIGAAETPVRIEKLDALPEGYASQLVVDLNRIARQSQA